jgi:hypothetical protein
MHLLPDLRGNKAGRELSQLRRQSGAKADPACQQARSKPAVGAAGFQSGLRREIRLDR